MITLIVVSIICGAAFLLSKPIANTTEIGASIIKTAAVSLLLLTVGLNSLHNVPPGHRGIQVNWDGKMNMEPLTEGWQFVNPLSSVDDRSVQNRSTSQYHTAETIDTQTIKLKIVVNYRPNPERITYLEKENTEKWESVVLSSIIDDAVKAEIGLHKVTDVVKNRPLIKSNLEKSIVARFTKYDVEVKEVNVTELDFSDEYDKAIEAKQVAEQDSQRMLNVLAKTRTEADMAKAKAEGEANAKIEEARGLSESAKLAARGKAEALQIEGEAQADYNAKVAKSLTPELIQRLYLERWNGTLPTFMAGGSDSKTTFLLPMTK